MCEEAIDPYAARLNHQDFDAGRTLQDRVTSLILARYGRTQMPAEDVEAFVNCRVNRLTNDGLLGIISDAMASQEEPAIETTPDPLKATVRDVVHRMTVALTTARRTGVRVPSSYVEHWCYELKQAIGE